MLFQYDMSKGQVDSIVPVFWRMNPQPEAIVQFANRLFKGTVAKLPEIDTLIQNHAKNWRLERMAAVDRNILRLAVYEFLEEPETPKPVVINEALEIAKKYSTDESAQFVNGILDSVKADLVSNSARNKG